MVGIAGAARGRRSTAMTTWDQPLWFNFFFGSGFVLDQVENGGTRVIPDISCDLSQFLDSFWTRPKAFWSVEEKMLWLFLEFGNRLRNDWFGYQKAHYPWPNHGNSDIKSSSWKLEPSPSNLHDCKLRPIGRRL